MANTYKLYFYTSTKGSGVTPTSKLSMTFGSSSLNVTLLRVKYKKKVYEPCEILAELSIEGLPKNSEVEATFLNQKVDMEVEYETADKKTKSVTIATNYFVYKVRPIYNVTSTSSMTVELGIYSADKVMTLDKYSRAYTAKKLYTDILAKESDKFHLNDNSDSTKCTKLSTLVANHMQMLKYKVEETVSSTSSSSTSSSESTSEVAYTDELRIPYIVQYNESFYQFMVRAANRYGEFLYFEDGKLNLGMQPSEANYYKLDSSGKLTTEALDWSQETTVQRRYYESVLSEGITIEDRAYNYMDHEETSSSTYAGSSENRYNFDAVPTDEWTEQDLKKLFYRTQKELWQEELQTLTVETVFKALNNSSLGDFLVSLGLEFGKKIYDTIMFGINCNYTMKQANYEPIKDNNDQISGSNYCQFATYNGSKNLKANLKDLGQDGIMNFTDAFYPLIRKKEKKVGEQAVWLEFGENFTPIMLGDKLRVEETDYVVISVEGSYDIIEKDEIKKETSEDGKSIYDRTETLLVSAVPVMEIKSIDAVEQKVDSATGSDAWTNTLPVPPAIPDVIIRDARPQVAFVVEATDPQYLGRIRVRYPWQDSSGDASPWIRVTLPLATSGGAVNFTPSEGDEVMVGYEHGNIDRPYGMGYLTAPFVTHRWENSLPFDHWGGEHGIKVKTGHHLTFTDGANGASLFANMFGPLACVKSIYPVGFFWPAPTCMQDLGGGFELSDRYGFYKIKGCTEDRMVSIESPMGTVELNAFQGITISAPNGDVNITGKNVTISANNSLNITSGETIKDRFFYQKEWKDSKVKSMFSSLGASAWDTFKSSTLEEFLDVSFLRCVLEVLLRPVDGTLQIKSYTFIQMEAGTGVTEIPEVSLRRDQKSKDDIIALEKLNNTVSLVEPNVRALIVPIMNSYAKLLKAKDAFMSISDVNGINKDQKAITFKNIVEYACGNDGKISLVASKDDFFKFSAEGLGLKKENNQFNDVKPDKPTNDLEYIEWLAKEKEYKLSLVRDSLRDQKIKKIVAKSNELRIAALALSGAIKKWKDTLSINTNGFINDKIDKDKLSDLIGAEEFVGDEIQKSLDNLKTGNYDHTDIVPVANAIWEKQIKAISRYVMYKYVTENKSGYSFVGAIHNEAEAFDDTTWKAFVQSIEEDDIKFFSRHNPKVYFGNKWAKFRDEFTDSWRKWKNGYEGKILFSDSAANTISFGKQQNLVSSNNVSEKSNSIAALCDKLISI